MKTHPKMKYTYVGVDSHKDTHTAVFLDCFFEKLGEISFGNRPSKFNAFLFDALRMKMDGTELLFGLEDVSSYGRGLLVFLKDKGQAVKHVNAFLVAEERGRLNTGIKNDSIDAECAARVLLSRFGSLPDANPQDNYWILRSVVVRRRFLIKNNTALKKSLHNLLFVHYPYYQEYFDIGCNTSLAFYAQYPSPEWLKGVTAEELAAFLEIPSRAHLGIKKAKEILNSLEDTAIESSLQNVRDMTVQSIVRQIQFNLNEVKRLEVTLAHMMDSLNTTLTTMNGIDTVSAAQILSCIGDIRRFPSPAKLARHAGVAPITYASGKNDTQYANQRGNRELSALFYQLALCVTMTAGPKKRVMNHFFYEYYHKKISEGKTKGQALKCVQRRLVNIIWTMLTNNEEYVNPPLYNL